MYEFKTGVTGDDNIHDFLVGDIEVPELSQQDSIIYQYNQGDSKDCTLYSSIGALSDLMNDEFSNSEISEIIKLSYEKGRIPGEGRKVFEAVDLVRNRWNAKNPDKKVLSFKLNIGDEQFNNVIDKGYTVVTNYGGDYKYNQDFKDGILDGDKFGITYRHAVNIVKIKGVLSVKDSYFGRLYNIYGIKDINNLVKNAVYSPNGYVFIPEKKIVKSKQQIKVETELNLLKKINSSTRNDINLLQHEIADSSVKNIYQSIKENLHGVNLSINKILP